MNRSRLERLRTLTGREIGFRLRTGVRIQAQRAGAAIRTPRWDRARLRRALTAAAYAQVRPTLARGNWTTTQRQLESLLTDRPSRFVLQPASASLLRRQILRRWPDAGRDAAARGDRILDGRYDLLGYEDLAFGAPPTINWHLDPVHDRCCPPAFWADVGYLNPGCGDHKIIWELNRHQHWLALGRACWLTGDTRYAAGIIEQLDGWLTANPPLTGINWASMLEVALRSLSWVWTIHFLLGRAPSSPPQPWLVDLLVGLDRQLNHVEQNLSRYFSPNTHLTGEALALYVAGTALPELARSDRWARTGRRILLQEIPRQIGRDGGHAERSFHYHRYTLDFYLLALLTAERVDDHEAAAIFAAAVARLAEFLRTVADDRGWIQQVGDDDGGMLWPAAGRHPRDVRDSLALAAVALDRPALAPWGQAEEAFWMAWGSRADTLAMGPPRHDLPLPASRPVRTTLFDETGYAVICDGHGDHLVFDVGQHGYLNGGHAHADALAVTLSAAGLALLVDPGTATYTMDPALRDRLRGTAAHNTLTLDGRPSSIPAGPFHWRTTADAHIETSRHNACMAWVEATHNGFTPLLHRRSVLHVADGPWWVIDCVDGSGVHAIDAYWHFDPMWSVTVHRRGIVRADADDRTAWILHGGSRLTLERGDTGSGLGWYSPIYGRLVPAWTARLTHAAAAPFSTMTCIVHGDRDEPPPTREDIHVISDPGAPAVAARIRQHRRPRRLQSHPQRHQQGHLQSHLQGHLTTLAMVRPGDIASRTARACDVGGYRTDARVLQSTMSGDRVQAVALADARYLIAGSADLSLMAEDRLDDLHVSISGDRMDLSSSRPASRFALRGDPLRAVRVLRLNGRERDVRPSESAESTDCVTVDPLDWSTSSEPRDIADDGVPVSRSSRMPVHA